MLEGLHWGQTGVYSRQPEIQKVNSDWESAVDSHDLIRLTVTFLIDCGFAYAGHLAAPHPKNAMFIRKNLWLVIIPIVAAGQFVIYESYVIERPLVAYVIMLLLAVFGGLWWLGYEAYSSGHESVTLPERIVFKWPKFRKRAKPILGALCALYVLFLSVWIFLQRSLPSEHIIVVARFSGPRADTFSPRDILLSDLIDAAESMPNIKVLPSRTFITLEDGPEAARSLGNALIGRRHDATIVIWGWYKMANTDGLIEANMEPTKTYASILGQIQSAQRHRRIYLPIQEFLKISFEFRLSDEIRPRTFFILGILGLLTRNLEQAEQYFTLANEGAYPWVRTIDLTRTPPSVDEHYRDGALVDLMNASPQSYNEPQISGNPVVLMFQGFVNYMRHQIPYAQRDWATAALLAPDQARHYYDLSHTHLYLHENADDVSTKLSELQKASEDCLHARIIDGGADVLSGCMAMVEYWRGTYSKARGALDYQQHYNKAIQEWSRIINMDPSDSDADAYNRRGELHYLLGDYSKAEQDLSKSIELNPHSAEAFNYRGAARMELKKWPEGVKDLETAVNLAPADARFWCNLGIALAMSENIDRAKDAYSRCQDLAPEGELREHAERELQHLK